MEELLCFRNVEISYQGKAVVRDVSFSLHRGEILGIVGESGSGKSTLLKAAMGLLGKTGLVTRGDILYGGKNLPDLTEKERMEICGDKIGMIFQHTETSFCPIRTIGSQICESVQAHSKLSKEEVYQKAMKLFAKLQFQDGNRIWESYPFELSGGMSQRIGIALAMLCEPDILLADEPTSALDVVVQSEVVAEFLRVREWFGVSMILVTHDIGVAAALADSVLVLRQGAVMEYGPSGQVLSCPQSAYTKQLLAAVPVLRRKGDAR